MNLSRSNLARSGSPDPGQKRGFGNPLGAILGLLSLLKKASAAVPRWGIGAETGLRAGFFRKVIYKVVINLEPGYDASSLEYSFMVKGELP